MFIKAAAETDLLPGGTLAVKISGRDIVLCNVGGTFYAVERACGHASARLEKGALTGHILTCPLHFAQFDVRTGTALSGPIPKAPLHAHPDPKAADLVTRGLKTWPVKTENGAVLVDLA